MHIRLKQFVRCRILSQRILYKYNNWYKRNYLHRSLLVVRCVRTQEGMAREVGGSSNSKVNKALGATAGGTTAWGSSLLGPESGEEGGGTSLLPASGSTGYVDRILSADHSCSPCPHFPGPPRLLFESLGRLAAHAHCFGSYQRTLYPIALPPSNQDSFHEVTPCQHAASTLS